MGKSFSVDEVDMYPMERMWDGDRRLPAFGYTIETVQMLMIPMVKTRYIQPPNFRLVGVDYTKFSVKMVLLIYVTELIVTGKLLLLCHGTEK